MTIESNKFFFEDEGNYDDYDFLKQELIEELYLKEKLRDYDFTIYLIFYKYLELLGEDLNNEFLKSILSNTVFDFVNCICLSIISTIVNCFIFLLNIFVSLLIIIDIF